MTPAEKGKVICELKKLYKQKGEKKNAEKIGNELFGLAKAMTYRCIQAYQRTSDKKEKSSSSKQNKFDFKKFMLAVDKLPKTTEDIEIKDVEQGVEQLKAILEIEGKLNSYKALLLKREDVKEAYENQDKKSTVADTDLPDSKR